MTAALLLAALLVGTVVALAAPASHAAPAQQIRLEGPIAEGVHLRERVDPGPVTSVSIEVQPNAPVAFVPVLSQNRIDGGTEYTSSMCDRVGGVVCINANYAVCSTCGQPFGGLVQDGVLLRSPTPFQDQVSVINGRFTLERWMWSAGLWSRKGGPSLDFHGVNTGLSPGGLYLYTRAYGDSTGAPPGTFELVVQAPKPLWTGIGQRQKVAFLALRNQGDTTIPPDGAVISAYGAAADELRRFIDRNKQAHVELVVNTPGGLEQSFAGHPIILRDGQVQQMDPADGKVSGRHPRSLIGWNDAGRKWIVVIDGRQDHSRGMTLWEAAEHLRSLGAQHAVNFDGGGSSTMVTACPSPTGWCLRNRPSDGRERNVWVAVALVPRAPAPPAPAPEPEPKPEPKPDAPAPTAPKPADPEGGPDRKDGQNGGGAGDPAARGGGPEDRASPDDERGPDGKRGPDGERGPMSDSRADDAVLWTPAASPDSEPPPEPRRGSEDAGRGGDGDEDLDPGEASSHGEAPSESAASAGQDPHAPLTDATVDTADGATGAVVPAGEGVVDAGGLVEPVGGRSVPVAAIAAAVVMVIVEAAALGWLLRRRRIRSAGA